MKKVVRCFWLFLLVLLLVGCTSAEEKKENEDFRTLESFGLSEKQAKNFYGYSNSAKLLFKHMTKANESLKDNDYEITHEQSKSIYADSNTLEDYYVLLAGENEDLDDFLWKTDGSIGGPQKILSNIKSYKREMSITEATVLYDNLKGYALESLEAIKLSTKDQESLIKWYHENNEYTGLFKEAHDHRN